ncbi:hypothetical protein BY996DRAFT_6579407 [Phakopsora pachyrhizi]|nr:hypothetical protein BY996DRAFT_6579407 [Phakopsora pachyrhizi]
MDALPVTNPTLPTEHVNFCAVMVPFYKIADAFKKDDPTLPDYSFRTTPIIIKEADGWAGEYKRVFVELLLFLLLMPAEENANEVVELDGLAEGTVCFGEIEDQFHMQHSDCIFKSLRAVLIRVKIFTLTFMKTKS